LLWNVELSKSSCSSWVICRMVRLLNLNLSINSKSSYISNGLVIYLQIRSLLLALLTSSIRYRLSWNLLVTFFLFWNEFIWADLYKESIKMLHSMNCTLAIRYYSCMNRYVDIFNLKTRLVVPTTNIYIFDAINQVNCPGNVTHTFCWDMN
jgi:hypothetical protein